MYSDNRNAYRETFFLAWQKHLKDQALDNVEKQIVAVILQHPEYHTLLSNQQQSLSQEFTLEENPFFHMSLHIAVQEQIAQDRPHGVRAIFNELKIKCGADLAAEHFMTDCLAQTLWQAQQTGLAADENRYLEKLRSAINS